MDSIEHSKVEVKEETPAKVTATESLGPKDEPQTGESEEGPLLDSLEARVKYTEQINLNVVCDICRKKFKNISSLIIHEPCFRERKKNSTKAEDDEDVGPFDETNGDLLACDYCRSLFEHIHDLRDHYSEHVDDEPYGCSRCPKTFHRLFDAEKHVKLHSEGKVFDEEKEGGEEDAFDDEELEDEEEALEFRPNPAKKLKLSPKGKKGSSGVVFKPRKGKKKECHKEKEKFFTRKTHNLECNFCRGKFSCRASVLVHVPCFFENMPVDPAEAVQVPSVRIKKTKKTTNGKPVKKDLLCQFCGRAFSRLDYLRNHVAFHLEKDFECNLCRKKFASRDLVIRHLRVHTGEYPLECNLCGKCFGQKQVLEEHVKCHGGQKKRKKTL